MCVCKYNQMTATLCGVSFSDREIAIAAHELFLYFIYILLSELRLTTNARAAAAARKKKIHWQNKDETNEKQKRTKKNHNSFSLSICMIHSVMHTVPTVYGDENTREKKSTYAKSQRNYFSQMLNCIQLSNSVGLYLSFFVCRNFMHCK